MLLILFFLKHLVILTEVPVCLVKEKKFGGFFCDNLCISNSDGKLQTGCPFPVTGNQEKLAQMITRLT